MKAATRDTLALTFASLFPLAMAWIYFIFLPNQPEQADGLILKAYGIGKVIQFGFPLVYVFLFDRGSFRIGKPRWDGLLLGLGFALIVDIAMAALYFGVLRDGPYLADAPVKIITKLREAGLASPDKFFWVALFVCGPHSLWEEYYWRWFVFGHMRRHLPDVWAILLSSIGFMLHHVVILYVYFPDRFWMLVVPLSLSVAFGGAVWAWIYRRSDSLLAPWLSHALIDAGILLVGYDLLKTMW